METCFTLAISSQQPIVLFKKSINCIKTESHVDDYPYPLSLTYISLNCSARLSQINLIFAGFFSHCQYASNKYHKTNILQKKRFSLWGKLKFLNEFADTQMVLDLVPKDIFHMKQQIYSDSSFNWKEIFFSKFSLRLTAYIQMKTNKHNGRN